MHVVNIMSKIGFSKASLKIADVDKTSKKKRYRRVILLTYFLYNASKYFEKCVCKRKA